MHKKLKVGFPRQRGLVSKNRKSFILAAAALSVGLSAPARADKNWKTTIPNGNWNVNFNWAEGTVPGSGDNIFIYFNDGSPHTITYDTSFASNLAMNLQNQGAGSVNLQLNSSLPLTVGWTSIGALGRAAISQTAGTFTANSFIALGDNPGTTGTYTLGGNGVVNVGGSGGLNGVFVGGSGIGYWTQNAGTFTATAVSVFLGSGNTGNGTVNLSGTGVFNANFGTEYIGYLGNGTFIQNGGTHNLASGVNLNLGTGSNTGATGYYAMQSGALNAGGNLIVGDAGTGTMLQTGGTVSVGSAGNPRNLYVTYEVVNFPSIPSGRYTLNGPSAVLNVSQNAEIGQAGYGTFDHQAGTFNVTQSLELGFEGTGTYNLSGGSLLVAANEYLGGFDGTGVVNQSGGLNSVGGNLSVGSGGAAFGTYNLTGGTLNVGGPEYLFLTTFNQSGGVHKLGTPAIPTNLTIGSGFGALAANGIYALSGSGSFTVNGSVTMGSEPMFGFTPRGRLAISGGTMSISDVLDIQNVGPAATSNGNVATLSGGLLIAGTINTNGDPSRFQWSAGTLNISGIAGLTVGGAGPIGSSFALDASKSLRVNNPLVIAADGSISLSGGTLLAGTLNTGGEPGRLLWSSGTVAITGPAGLVIGSGGQLGSSLIITSGKSLQVNNTATISSSGLLLVQDAGVANADGAISNSGEIQLDGSASRLSGGALNNSGLVLGNGRVGNSLSNAAAGEVRASDTDRLVFTAATNTNSGRINLLNGGMVEFTGALSNASTGRIAGRGTFKSAGLNNNGQVSLSAGLSDFFGPITNNSGSRILITGASTTTFYDPITHNAGAEIFVADNSAAVFLSSITGSGLLSGPGIKYFSGGTSSLAALDTTGSTVVDAGASLSAGHVREASLTVSGSVAIPTNGSSTGTSRVNSLTIRDSGQMDLRDNDLIVDYSGPVGTLASDVRQYLIGAQLTSSAADGTHRLGYADNALLGLPTLGGQPVDSSSVLVKYTYAGDANLDGQVNIQDLFALATHYNTVSNQVWTSGDFNYDGAVNNADLALLARTWQLGVGAPLGEPLDAKLGNLGLPGASVPEPLSAALAAILGVGLARRRRR